MRERVVGLLKEFFRNPGYSPDLDVESYHLATVIHFILTSGVFVYLSIAIMFFATGLTVAGALNVACCVLMVIAKHWNATRSHNRAILLASLDTVISAVSVQFLGGPGTNYEIYMLIILCFLPLMPKPAVWVRALLAFLVVATYVAIIALGHLAPPPLYQISVKFMLFMRVSNILAAFLLMEFVVFFLHMSVRTSYVNVRRMADTDPLTGLLNRRGMQGVMRLSKMECEVMGRPWSVMMGDLDHFKALNDSHGHKAGDDVLKAVAGAVAKALRSQDRFARWGGEEFLVFLPGIQGRELETVADRVMKAVRTMPVPLSVPGGKVTISLGTTTSAPLEAEAVVIARADSALYRAKAEGRDRAVWLGAGNALGLPPFDGPTIFAEPQAAGSGDAAHD
jgi:diguanylate cyclase (GGDEF)-like protein